MYVAEGVGMATAGGQEKMQAIGVNALFQGCVGDVRQVVMRSFLMCIAMCIVMCIDTTPVRRRLRAWARVPNAFCAGQACAFS